MIVKAVSKYEKLIEIIKRQILAQKYPPGSKIPTEPELCDKYKVGRNTVREAISSLVHEGLLVKIQGKGTFVVEKRSHSPTSEKGLIGFLFSGPITAEDSYHFEVFRGICAEAKVRGYEVLFNNVSETPPGESLEKSVGFIISSTLRNSMVSKIAEDSHPFVVYGKESDLPDVHTVCPDYCEGAAKAVDYLYRAGYKNIILVNEGPDENKRYERWYEGYLEGLKKNNITVREELIWSYNDIDEKLDEFTKQIKSGKSKFSYAAFIPNDTTTVEVMEKMSTTGIKIPDDIAIIGFYDRDISRYTTPKLTTVGFNREDIARAAMDTLLNLIEGKQTEKKKYIPVHLVVRNSVMKR